MAGKQRRRSNLFKRGRRGRRGRVPFDIRWLHAHHVDPVSDATGAENTFIIGNRDPPSQEYVDIQGTRSVWNATSHGHILLNHEGDTQSRDPTDTHEIGLVSNATTAEHEKLNQDRNPSSRDPTDTREIGEPASHITSERTCSPVNDVDEEQEAHLRLVEPLDIWPETTGQTSEPEMNPTLDTEHCYVQTFADEDIDSFSDDEVLDCVGISNTIEANAEQPIAQNNIGPHEVDGIIYNQICIDNASLNTIASQERLAEVVRGCRKLTAWENLLSVILVTGSVRFSVEHFRVFRACLNTVLSTLGRTNEKIPSYSTVKQTLVPFLRDWSYVKSGKVNALIDYDRSGARDVSGNGSSTERHLESFVVIQPSSWSAMDVSCRHTWNILKQASCGDSAPSAISAFHGIQSVPMVRCREYILDVLLHSIPRNNDNQSFGCALLRSTRCPDSCIEITVRKRPELPLELLQSYGMREQGEMLSVQLQPVRSEIVQSGTTYQTLSDFTLPRSEVIHGTFAFMREAVTSLWSAGDICTVLRSQTENLPVIILVHHQARHGRLTKRMELVILPFRTYGSDEDMTCLFSIQDARKLVISDVKVAMGSPPLLPHVPTLDMSLFPTVPPFGTLKNGMKYFVDHILLYSDGFSQYAFKKGSAGGVYCLSLNYPSNQRRSRERVRVLALTPPGVSTKEGLRAVIPDLVSSSTKGNVVRNADGEEILVFTEVVGFVCDYHEVGHVIDLLGPTSNSPCHLCSFKRFRGHPSTASQYAHTTEVHSGDACFARMGIRTEALRGCDMSDEELVGLGLKKKEQAVAGNSPLVELYQSMKEAIKHTVLPLTENNVPVVNPCFDPYRSVLVAPDHLLAGIAINEMNLGFKLLPNNRRRKQADALICRLLLSNGLLGEARVFNFNNSSLYTTSISNTFCALLVSCAVFKEIVESLRSPEEMSTHAKQEIETVIRNMCLFKELVSRTYWYPTEGVDDPHSVISFSKSQGTAYIAMLEELCIRYIQNCNDICKKSPVARKELDKPNVHRLLELYKHSLPAMGHVRHFSELIFECAHQPLKRAMAKSNYRDSHIQSVQHCIADDWKARLASTYIDCINTEDGDEAGIPLLKFLCGREALDINELTATAIWKKTALSDRVSMLLRNEVIRNTIGLCSNPFKDRLSRKKWVLTVPSKVNNVESISSRTEVTQLVMNYLTEASENEVRFFDKAKRVMVWSDGTSRKASHAREHDTLTFGTVVRALVDDQHSISIGVMDAEEDEGVLKSLDFFVSHFVVEHLFEVSEANSILGFSVGHRFAAVRRCAVVDQRYLQVKTGTGIQLLRLTGAVRRVAIIHACSHDPNLACVDHRDDVTNCYSSIFKGHLYHYFGREDGYPPRMA